MTLADAIQRHGEQLLRAQQQLETTQHQLSQALELIEGLAESMKFAHERIRDLERLASGKNNPAAWNRVRDRADESERSEPS